jgi:hypothetical protein
MAHSGSPAHPTRMTDSNNSQSSETALSSPVPAGTDASDLPSTFIRTFGQSPIQRWVTSPTLCRKCRAAQVAVAKGERHSFSVQFGEMLESECGFCEILARAARHLGDVPSEEEFVYHMYGYGVVFSIKGRYKPQIQIVCKKGTSSSRTSSNSSSSAHSREMLTPALI